MRAPAGSAALVRAILIVATVATFVVVSSARADTPSLEHAERAAVLELYAVESALARADDEADGWDRRLSQLKRQEQHLRRDAEIVRRSQAVTQARIAAIVRALYENDQPVDPIAIVLSAESLDAALEGVDSLSRAAALHRRLIDQARERGGTVRRALDRLTSKRARLETVATAARVSATRLEEAAAAKSASLATIRRDRNLSRERIARLAEQAAAAQATSAELVASTATPAASSEELAAAPAAPPPPLPAPGGTRTMVVDAVAYHLPGTTASGLPVGIGVIAVDPTVIPLGTRVFVPGYGPAVAADTGSAIKGRIIDLWMPTTAQAIAWGRRTVTITIYG